MQEQKERDDRIRIQHEREEAARLERLNKQKEYNGTILADYEQNQLPVAFELVLETNLNSGEILIEVDLMLVQYMKKHQGKIFRMIRSIERESIGFSRGCSISMESSIRIDATYRSKYRS